MNIKDDISNNQIFELDMNTINTIQNYISNIMLFFAIWTILGIISFITSLVCFRKSGNLADKVLGFLLSVLFGPLYFIYLYNTPRYCR